MAKNEGNNEEWSSEGQLNPAESNQSLRSTNPAWRNVAIGACCLASVAVGVSLLRAHYQSVATIPPADVAPVGSAQAELAPQACALKSPDVGQDLFGRVVAFVSAQQALETIKYTQALVGGNISPDYLTQRRVLVEVGTGAAMPRPTVIVPDGMTVRVGDKVEYTGGHRARGLPCHFIPNVISRIVASGESGQ
jgi:hypothetical protein